MIHKFRPVESARTGRPLWGLFLVLALAAGTIDARCDDDNVAYSMHRGKMQARHFVLLTPVDADRNPARALSVPELVHLSRLASPIHAPVAMSLVAIDPDEHLPALVSDEEGTSVLQVKLRSTPMRGRAPHD